jgi:hypothetical protein
MKLEDAKPGDVLQDRDGAVWVNAQREIWACIFDPANPRFDSDGDALWSAADAEKFGPFVRLVPEEASEW